MTSQKSYFTIETRQIKHCLGTRWRVSKLSFKFCLLINNSPFPVSQIINSEQKYFLIRKLPFRLYWQCISFLSQTCYYITLAISRAGVPDYVIVMDSTIIHMSSPWEGIVVISFLWNDMYHSISIPLPNQQWRFQI